MGFEIAVQVSRSDSFPEKQKPLTAVSGWFRSFLQRVTGMTSQIPPTVSWWIVQILSSKRLIYISGAVAPEAPTAMELNRDRETNIIEFSSGAAAQLIRRNRLL
jgi:hypothetical protein